MTSAASLAFTKRVWGEFMKAKGHDFTCLSTLELKSARPGYITAQLPIEQSHVNRLGSLHGGLVSTLVDIGGSLALASKGLYSTGVSTDLNVTFLRSGGSVGDKVDMQASVVSMGRTLAFTTVDLTQPGTGKILVQGRHTKFIGTALKGEQNEIEAMKAEEAKLQKDKGTN